MFGSVFQREELRKYSLREVHPAYEAEVNELAARTPQEKLKAPQYPLCCPYCGQKGRLRGDVRLGVMGRDRDMELGRGGCVLEPEERRPVEILLIHCRACHAAVDPMAYLGAEIFLRERLSTTRLLQSQPLYGEYAAEVIRARAEHVGALFEEPVEVEWDAEAWAESMSELGVIRYRE